MRTFFLQLFLSFWLATLAIFAAAIFLFPGELPQAPPVQASIIVGVLEHSLRLALSDYREHGCAAHDLSDPTFVIADERGQPLCQRVLGSQQEAVLQRAVRSQAPAGERLGQEWLNAAPLHDDNGHQWFIVTRSPFGKRLWFPALPKSALPVSVVVTFIFAWLLTRSLRALSKAFRAFTAGDLNTRLPASEASRWARLDSADIRTLKADFNAMADRVSELIDAHKLLVRDISHELRSPLTRLRLAVEMAREDPSPAPVLFEHMGSEIERVNELIGEMLTLSLLESTRTPPRAVSVDLCSLVSDLTESANFEANARGCSVVLRSGSAQCQVYGQPEMLSRAVENVLRNAIRYTPQGGTVEVELQEDFAQTVAGENGVVIAVRDTGPGIPDLHLSNVFRPFYRVDMARSDNAGGFGVGLAISERAIHLHGGRITARNHDEGGLEVLIYLPRRPPAE